jgi:RNA polymerase primary sigma factor
LQETPNPNPGSQSPKPGSAGNPGNPSNASPGKGRPKRDEIIKVDAALAAYMLDIKRAKTLTLAEEQALAIRIKGGDKQALNALVEANLKFVVSVCRNYQHQGMPLGDLINEGNLGLMRAAQRFDGSLNFKFISYAVWWIRQSILMALAEQSRVMNISPAKVGVIHRIGKASRKLEQKLGRQPSLSEVAEEMGLTEKEVAECLQLAATPISLNRPPRSEEEPNFEEVIPDTNAVGPDEEALKSLFSKSMDGVLKTLDEREEQVLRLYFGIGTQGAMTLTEIAERLELTRERIRQIKEKGLGKLRHPTRSKHFE